MSYKIKEIFYTLQGEGAMAGRPAVFCRFSGCNLWSGREEDRSKAICKFCDTDFWGMDGTLGGSYNAHDLAEIVNSLWPNANGNKYIVCTGGEPLLQLDEQLVDAFKTHGFEVAIETNGTILAPKNIDWICVSPKANTEILQTSGNEIKIVYPQSGINPNDFKDYNFNHFYIQPMDNENRIENTKLAIEYCMQNTKWKLSVQSHKIVGIR